MDLEALTPPRLFPLRDDHSGNLQAIHFWATDLVDHFDSGEVKMGEQRGYSFWEDLPVDGAVMPGVVGELLLSCR